MSRYIELVHKPHCFEYFLNCITIIMYNIFVNNFVIKICVYPLAEASIIWRMTGNTVYMVKAGVLSNYDSMLLQWTWFHWSKGNKMIHIYPLTKLWVIAISLWDRYRKHFLNVNDVVITSQPIEFKMRYGWEHMLYLVSN